MKTMMIRFKKSSAMWSWFCKFALRKPHKILGRLRSKLEEKQVRKYRIIFHDETFVLIHKLVKYKCSTPSQNKKKSFLPFINVYFFAIKKCR